MNTNQKGAIAELAIATDLLERGFQVALPCGVNSIWDLVFTRDGSVFERVQVKYRRATNGTISVPAFSQAMTNGKAVRRPYELDQLEWVAVFEPDSRKIFYLPMLAMVSGQRITLRVKPSKNNQKAGVHNAADYQEPVPIVQRITRQPAKLENAGSNPAGDIDRVYVYLQGCYPNPKSGVFWNRFGKSQGGLDKDLIHARWLQASTQSGTREHEFARLLGQQIPHM